MNRLERAVIEAARALVRDAHDVVTGDATVTNLQDAIAALDAAQLPQEIGWHEVAEGDQLRSAKNGRFYPVIGTMALNTKPTTYRIKIQAGDKEITVTRPSLTEPTAFVQPGQTGQAVSAIIQVMWSGER